MGYWLVNAGTVADPLPATRNGVAASFKDWDERHGSVHGVDKAYAMQPGDRLIYRTVGMPVSRLVAVARVVEPPRAEKLLRWDYRVPREVEILIPTLRYGPAFELLQTPPTRMTKKLSDAQDDQAVELLAAAAAKAATGHV